MRTSALLFIFNNSKS